MSFNTNTNTNTNARAGPSTNLRRTAARAAAASSSNMSSSGLGSSLPTPATNVSRTIPASTTTVGGTRLAGAGNVTTTATAARRPSVSSRPVTRPPSRTRVTPTPTATATTATSTPLNGTRTAGSASSSSFMTTTQIGMKRKVRAASGDADKDTAKRPTLTTSAAFASHMAQSATQRQLILAEAKVSELENALRERDAKVERLEADLRMVVEREEKEKVLREEVEKELAGVTEERDSEISSLKKQLSELIVDQEEMHDDFERLLREANAEKENLRGELELKANEVEFLQGQREEAEVYSREREERIRELEDTLEAIGESGLVGELGELSDDEEEEIGEKDDFSANGVGIPITEEGERPITPVTPRKDSNGDEQQENSREDRVAIDGVVTSVSSDADSDIDADGEIDEDDEMSIDASAFVPTAGSSVGAQHSPLPSRMNEVQGPSEVEVVEVTSAEPSPPIAVIENAKENNEPELEYLDFTGGAYPDPGAPPPYTVSSPTVSPPPIRARDADVESVASSRPSPAPPSRSPAPSSIQMSATPNRRAPTGTPFSLVSTPTSRRSMSIVSEDTPSRLPSQRPDPLAHVRDRLGSIAGHGSPSPSARSSASHNAQSPHRRRLSSRRLSALSSSLSAAASLSASAARDRTKDTAVIRAELSKQRAHLARLEAEHARVVGELGRAKERVGNAEVLREEIRGLKREVEVVGTLRRRIAELEEVQKEVRREGEEWRVRALKAEREMGQQGQQQQLGMGGGGGGDENASGTGSPARVAQQLASLRRSHAVLLDEAGQLKAILRSREVELEELRSNMEAASTERDEAVRNMEAAREVAGRHERGKALAEREIVFLKSLIASYKTEGELRAEEDSENGGAPGAVVVKNEQPKVDDKRGTEQLEALLEEYKTANAGLRDEIERMQSDKTDAMSKSQEDWNQLSQKVATLEQALESRETETKMHAERVEALEQQLFELGGEIGAGRHVPPKTRVWSLRENPAQAWADTRKEVLDKLKAENEALLKRITDLEAAQRPESSTAMDLVTESAASSTAVKTGDPSIAANTVPRASYDVLHAEVDSLQRDLAAREKRLLRLQQVFQAKSDEFKDALAALLGLKVAFYPNGQVRITSVYDLRAAFVFQPSKNAGRGQKKGAGSTPPSASNGNGGSEDGARMQLIAAGEGVPEELDGLMNMWIRDEMSIPCFLASVTLECYDRWKREGPSQ